MKYLIVGLGNIGDEYADTRHNIGFIVADAFVSASGGKFESGRYASFSKISYRGKNLVVIRPTTYMNLSGKAVRYWMNREKIEPQNLLVIVDDLALPLGTFRLRKKGSDGGHNGLISIIEHLGTTEFPRLRIGIGNDFARGYQIDYVLSRWTKEEEKILIPRVDAAIELIRTFVMEGADRTMNKFNS
ncbi:MAG TPA: aminoacyl-tRNA hydrolase [Bacteroidales bacterium]|nr:aminoacyl-tRNA hydrolase [Bacteroidales bacterium]